MATKIERAPYSPKGLPAGTLLAPGGYRLIAFLLILIGIGIFAYSRQALFGDYVTGLRTIGTMGGATWGLYIAFDSYFVGVGLAGITLAVMIRLLNLSNLKPVSRMAELLAVIALILAGLTVLADLGQPLRGLINLFLYARPQSPFFGTFTLVISGSLLASLAYLYLDGRRDAARCAAGSGLNGGRYQGFYRFWAAGYQETPAEQERQQRVTFWLAFAILPLLVVAQSTLGLVFGLQVGRPGWFSAMQVPGFLVLAGLSGVGILIVIAAIARQALGEKNRLTLDVFRSLGNLLLVLTAAYLYFQAVEFLTSIYSGQQHQARIAMALLSGDYAVLFWSSIALMVIPGALLFGQYLRRRYSLPLIVLSGVLINLATMGVRYLIVVPSQTHGTLLNYSPGSYSPTWVEYGVILGLFALGTLLFTLFTKVFPLLEVLEPNKGGK